MTAPLQGINAVEFAEHAFVPAAAAVLAEWGADVIKTSHGRLLSRGIVGLLGWSCCFCLGCGPRLGLFVGHSLGEAVVQDADQSVGEGP